MQTSGDSQGNPVENRIPSSATTGVVVWGLGLVAVAAVYWLLRDRVLNVVTYSFQSLTDPALPTTYIIPALVVAVVAWVTYTRRSRAELGPQPVEAAFSPVAAGLPLLVVCTATWLWLLVQPPPATGTVASTVTFVVVCAAVVNVGWSIDRLGRQVLIPERLAGATAWAPWLLGVAIVGSTAWHTHVQLNLWRHFTLGYADFGLFTTELEHCLPFKDVGSLRFLDTRMGYHCLPMFYLLAVPYALVRSSAFLMVVGPLALNLAAVPFYQLAKYRSGSSAVALMVGLAWLALPSLSRLPYSNSYGFQSIYLAVPWLAFCFCLALRGRWRWSHVCLIGAMLCEETVCGVALGWGLYLILFTDRRRDGAWIAAASIGYLLLCTTLIIPFFAPSGDYTRMQLFGELTPAIIVERLARPRVWCYLLALGAPLMMGLWRAPRLLVVCLPTMVLVALMRDSDYLNIKFWHHSSVLVALFLAAAIGVTRHCDSGSSVGKGRRASLGSALGLLASVLILHQLMGSTPLAQSYRVYAAQQAFHEPDPRMEVVEFVRSRFPADRFVVIATERMAAHFIEYRIVMHAAGAESEVPTTTARLMILDRSDGWDPMIRSGQTGRYIAGALADGYTVAHERGPVIVLVKASP